MGFLYGPNQQITISEYGDEAKTLCAAHLSQNLVACSVIRRLAFAMKKVLALYALARIAIVFGPSLSDQKSTSVS